MEIDASTAALNAPSVYVLDAMGAWWNWQTQRA